jgi:presenilin-like A22 family membrane protease
MKHDKKTIAELLMWTLGAVLIAAMLVPFALRSAEPMKGSPVWLLLGVIIGMGIGGTVAWNFIIKMKKNDVIKVALAVGLAMVIGIQYVDAILPESVSYVPRVLLRFVVYGSVIALYIKAVNESRKSWEGVKKWYAVQNLILMLALAATVVIGAMLTPLVALFLLFLASIWDAYAVWKSKTMVVLANGFIDARAFPGFVVPKRKEKFAMLGGGDVFFIVVVAGSCAEQSMAAFWYMALWMFAGLVMLFAISKKEKFYPALPFIFAAALSGIVVSWL